MNEYGYPDLTRQEERIRKKVQQEIRYCDTCQAYDGGEQFWVKGEQTDLYDLFDDFVLSEESKENIASTLYCPDCGNECLDLTSCVGVAHDFEIRWEQYLEAAHRKYKGQIVDLQRVLHQSPMLGLSSRFGRLILREIKSGVFRSLKVKGRFYRARVSDTGAIFTVKEMRSAPTGSSNEGRFNHAGQSHFYLSREESTCVAEVAENLATTSAVNCIQYRLTKPVSKILDLSTGCDELTAKYSLFFVALYSSNILSMSGNNVKNWKPDYFVTRFIMDCAKAEGYEGIKYNSVKGYGKNYVFFNTNLPLKILRRPYIVDHKALLNPYEADLAEF